MTSISHKETEELGNWTIHQLKIQLLHAGKSKSILLRKVELELTIKPLLSREKFDQKFVPETISQEILLWESFVDIWDTSSKRNEISLGESLVISTQNPLSPCPTVNGIESTDKVFDPVLKRNVEYQNHPSCAKAQAKKIRNIGTNKQFLLIKGEKSKINQE